MSVMWVEKGEGGTRHRGEEGLLKSQFEDWLNSLDIKAVGGHLPTWSSDLFPLQEWSLTFSQNHKLHLCERRYSTVIRVSTSYNYHAAERITTSASLIHHKCFYIDTWLACSVPEFPGGCLGWSKYRLSMYRHIWRARGDKHIRTQVFLRALLWSCVHNMYSDEWAMPACQSVSAALHT